MINVRVFYKKQGRAKYISALDVNRMAARALKRADNEHGLKFWYTEGFNPHLYVSFALPLSLGYESEYEAMDIRLLDDNADLVKAKEIINSVFPTDMEVTDVKIMVNKPTAITNALYNVKYFDKEIDSEDLVGKFNEFFASEQIVVLKKGKKGFKTLMKEVDIKPDCEVSNVRAIDGGFEFELVACAGVQKTVNPSLLTTEFARFTGRDDKEIFISVVRKAIYMENRELFV